MACMTHHCNQCETTWSDNRLYRCCQYCGSYNGWSLWDESFYGPRPWPDRSAAPRMSVGGDETNASYVCEVKA